MNENYLEFFGFSDNPFKLTPDINLYYLSKNHEIALENLRYFYNSHEPFAVIIGEPGVGKTITIRKFIDEIHDKVEVAYILFPNLSPVELFLAILEDLKIDIPQDVTKNKLFSILRDFLINKKKEGKKVIIIIDEAQNLPVETLEELRIISNLETEDEKLVKILLAGQEELLGKIDRPDLKQLRQRITIMEKILPLDLNETKKYVLFKIHKAGGNVNIEEKVFKALYKYSKGYPRLINQIMERALIAAFLDEAKKLDKKHVISAVKSLELLKTKNDILKKSVLILFVFIFIVSTLGYGFYQFSKKYNGNMVSKEQTISKKEIPKEKNTTLNNVYIMYLLADKNLSYLTEKKKELENIIKKPIFITKIKNGKLYAISLFYDDREKGLKDMEMFRKLTGIKDIFITRDRHNPEIVKQP